MITVERREPITEVENDEIRAHHDKDGIWIITNKKDNSTIKYCLPEKVRNKSEDFILGFLCGALGEYIKEVI